MNQIIKILLLLLLFPMSTFNLSAQKLDKDLMLQEVNKARSKRCRCGAKKYKSAPKLAWDVRLEKAAIRHAEDMASNNFLKHSGSDRSTVAKRITDEKFIWKLAGENIAEGYPSVSSVVAGWINSPGHCENIMNPGFTHMGAAVSNDGKYWVQVFAAPKDGE